MRKVWNAYELRQLQLVRREFGEGKMDFVTFHMCLSVLYGVN